MTLPNLSIKGEQVSQSPREISPVSKKGSLPWTGLGAGSQTKVKEFTQGPRWQAGLLACLFKSQVIWEEGGSLRFEELLPEEPNEGVPALPRVTNSEPSAVWLGRLPETPVRAREVGDGASAGRGQTGPWGDQCGPKAEFSRGLVSASALQGACPTGHGVATAQEDRPHSLPVEKVLQMVPETGVLGSEPR